MTVPDQLVPQRHLCGKGIVPKQPVTGIKRRNARQTMPGYVIRNVGLKDRSHARSYTRAAAELTRAPRQLSATAANIGGSTRLSSSSSMPRAAFAIVASPRAERADSDCRAAATTSG